MAQLASLWQHNIPQRAENLILSEKQPELEVPEPDGRAGKGVDSSAPEGRASGQSLDGTFQRQIRAHGFTKRRLNSVKTAQNARPIVAQPSPPPEQPKRKEVNDRSAVRTIPPWIRDADEEDLIEVQQAGPADPMSAYIAQHNHTPAVAQRLLPPSNETRVRRGGGGFPTSSGETRDQPTSRWVSFARASAYPREESKNEIMDVDWMNQNWTDYSKPWLDGHNEDDLEEGSSRYRAFRRKRRTWYKRAHFAIMRNPFVPLAFRSIVIVFAAAALGLGASILKESDKVANCAHQAPGSRTVDCAIRVGQGPVIFDRDPSALMATIVDAVAILYTLYITYDEYFSKPLGLRPAGAKVRLILLDLFFIVFQSANLSLAFNAITIDRGACRTGAEENTSLRFDKICDRAETLAGVLIVSLVAWLLTFCVSVLRLVERISR